MPSRARGLPDPAAYGDLSDLVADQLATWSVQRHLARRAGLHHDIRVGTPDTGLFSWAVPRGLPEPGQRHLAIRQPLHAHRYAGWEGTIPEGYGAGEVSLQDKGQVLVTHADPEKVHVTTAHTGVPTRYALNATGTGRGGHNWLLQNLTPTAPVPFEKKKYQSVPAANAESLLKGLPEGSVVQPKVDGASILASILKNRLELSSYRQSARHGGPIIHTERALGGLPKLDIPPHLRDSVLRGELYGAGPGGVIHPGELTPLLNAGLARSLKAQKEKGVDLKTMLYDVARRGGVDVGADVPYSQRRKWLEEFQPHLPEGKFHLPEEAGTPGEALDLWKKIRSGKHPLTREGVVVWPPTGTPRKMKLRDEADVLIRAALPGKGKYEGNAIGALQYSDPAAGAGGPVLGRVGSGLSDELRRELFSNFDQYKGRIARVRAQERLPSGALRGPSFVAFHEDYPAAGDLTDASRHSKTAVERFLRPARSAGSSTATTGAELVEVSLPLWKRAGSKWKFSDDREHQVLWLPSEGFCKAAGLAEPNARPDQQPGVSCLARHFGQVPQLERSWLQVLRWPWHQGLFKVAGKLREFSAGHGTEAISQGLHRPPPEQWKLRAGQLPLGFFKGQPAQPAQQPDTDLPGCDIVRGCMGGAPGISTGYHPGPAASRLDRRTGDHRADTSAFNPLMKKSQPAVRKEAAVITHLPIERLVNGSPKEAADYLSARAARARSGVPRPWIEKQAQGGSDVLTSLGKVMRDPVMGKALLGGGLGAAVGAGSHYFGAQDPKHRTRGMLGGALTGALAGGALGGGLGLAQKNWPGNIGGGFGGAGAGAGGGAPPGQFTMGGKTFQVDPRMSADNPELQASINELTQPTLGERFGPASLISSFWNNPLAPQSARYLPPVGVADFLLHNRALALGDRNWMAGPAALASGLGRVIGRASGGRTQLGLGTAGSYLSGLGERMREGQLPLGLSTPGMINPAHSTLGTSVYGPGHLEKGLDILMETKDRLSPQQRAAVEHLKGNLGRADLERLSRARMTGQPRMDPATGQPIPGTAQHDYTSPDVKWQQEATQQVGGQPVVTTRETWPLRGGPPQIPERTERTSQTPPVRYEKYMKEHTGPVTLEEALLREAKTLGAGGQAATASVDPALREAGASNRPRTLKGPLGGTSQLEASPFWGGRGLKRLALYGGVPLAEMGFNAWATEAARHKQLEEHIQELMKTPIRGAPGQSYVREVPQP